MEDLLDFQNEFKEPNERIVKNIDLHTLLENHEPSTDQCTEVDEPVSHEYKENAVEYW